MILSLVFLVACLSPVDHEKFMGRDIKDDFCGIPNLMEAKFCKCAFHADLCKEAGMTSAEAKKYIEGAFVKWEKEQENAWIALCEADPNKRYQSFTKRCEWCTQGYHYTAHDECIEDE